MTEFEPIDWVEFDDDIDDNEERAKNIIQKYRFDFDKIPKPEIVELIQKEIQNYQEGSSEYIRVLCGYLYCIGNAYDADGQRNAIIQYFIEYYCSYLDE